MCACVCEGDFLFFVDFSIFNFPDLFIYLFCFLIRGEWGGGAILLALWFVAL